MTALPAIYGPAPYSAPGLTATGSTQATALQLTAQINTFSTVAASTGAQLPAQQAMIAVTNYGVSALSLYPGSGDQIDNGTTNAAISISGGGGSWVGACTLPPTAPAPRNWATIATNSVGQFINGGTIQGATIETSAGFVFNSAASVTPAGTNLATAATITTEVAYLGTAASTTGVALPPSASTVGVPLLLINAGTAAIHVYGQGGDVIDTIAGTTGVTITNAHRCFFTTIASGTIVSGPSGTITS